tara:strand:- start:315 stop:611 length:297 start_codon:yes stop_codon:yes gene_type:complete
LHGFFLAAQGLQGLQLFFAAQGLQGLQAFLAAQGLQGLQAFLAAQGLHGLQAFLAEHGLQAFLGAQEAMAAGRLAVAVMVTIAAVVRTRFNIRLDLQG